MEKSKFYRFVTLHSTLFVPPSSICSTFMHALMQVTFVCCIGHWALQQCPCWLWPSVTCTGGLFTPRTSEAEWSWPAPTCIDGILYHQLAQILYLHMWCELDCTVWWRWPLVCLWVMVSSDMFSWYMNGGGGGGVFAYGSLWWCYVYIYDSWETAGCYV